ncbi:hypothetical protein HPB47_022336 [Ixodes persulcatus]|uniref:Uncharacterized protein n=1 Tax=Ixodes persulcatus TaxID=34615 RepID=A0AC60Q9Z1_IXOPE|nr:hypothetical protein HPB47_022336 [Ixodes persulcatus]
MAARAAATLGVAQEKQRTTGGNSKKSEPADPGHERPLSSSPLPCRPSEKKPSSRTARGVTQRRCRRSREGGSLYLQGEGHLGQWGGRCSAAPLAGFPNGRAALPGRSDGRRTTGIPLGGGLSTPVTSCGRSGSWPKSPWTGRLGRPSWNADESSTPRRRRRRGGRCGGGPGVSGSRSRGSDTGSGSGLDGAAVCRDPGWNNGGGSRRGADSGSDCDCACGSGCGSGCVSGCGSA